ncbi:MAG TPA: 2-C-methyl-D-erythritol 4-phosphate cytidylyltransferase [Casimicrobiaceae bacterium]|nr:2-C-methyl-D-erythritol 4-phosphate cytidylyltransferase [Casimicrobiaceae bacterium]
MPVRTWIIVPAAGGGVRFGAATPKQYADLGGRSVLAHTLERLAELDATAIVVALAADDVRFDELIGARPDVLPLRCGGATRGATVRNALRAIAPRCGDDDWVLVHDAARPCVPRESLARLVQELADDTVGGLLALPLADTLKRAAASDDPPRVMRTEEREGLWLAQTPQMFRHRLLAAAHGLDAAGGCTDEAQAIEALAATGVCAMPKLVRGSAANVKITHPGDLALAAAILRMQAADATGTT